MQATDWEHVAALYVVLGYLTPSPVVELNGAVAVGMAYGPARGLEIGDRLVGPPAPPPACQRGGPGLIAPGGVWAGGPRPAGNSAVVTPCTHRLWLRCRWLRHAGRIG